MAVPDVTVGVISDIHGVLPALRTAYTRLLHHYAPDIIICAGDVAAFGPDPSECVEFLVSHDVVTVRGNTDDYMAAGTASPNSRAGRMKQILKVMEWSKSRLSAFHREWLALLPFSATIGDTLVCLHAGPESNTQIVGPETPPPHVSNANIVCAGHLHRPFVAEYAKGIWANAGSVSRPTDGDRRGAFLVARRFAGDWSVEIVRFDLPLSEIINRVRATDMPYQERWCETQTQASWW